MRIPYPERLPLLPVLTFCFVLVLIQQLQGTTVWFSTGTTAFILLATLAFNVSGGLTRSSGVFIFAYSVIGVIFGIVYKTFVGEAGQSNLMQPELTIEVYVATVAGMLLVAYLNSRLRLKKSLLPRFTNNEDMRRAAVGSFFFGMIPFLLSLWRPNHAYPGLAGTILRALEGFLPLCILLGVTAEIRRSHGQSSITAFTAVAAGATFFQSILSFSKGGLFYAFAAWFIPAAAQRYKVSLLQVASILVALGWTTYYLVPYCQYGRDFAPHSESLSENFKINLILLENLGQVRKTYMANTAERFAGVDVPHYYSEPQGFAERIQMVTPDDQLIDATENGAVFGLIPTIYSFYNTIPHVLWPDKPAANFGTIYAHELGLLSEDDETTGISFSPSSDAFHQAKWVGVLVLLPALMLMLFFNTDSVCGDVRESPFAMLVSLGFLHSAPEAGIIQCAGVSLTGLLVLYAVAFICVRILPLTASLILGKPRVEQSLLAHSAR